MSAKHSKNPDSCDPTCHYKVPESETDSFNNPRCRTGTCGYRPTGTAAISTMAFFLLSIFSFVALAHARPHPARSAFESKGEKTSTFPVVGRRLTAFHAAVIAQMFEWSWDSVAAECTRFLGPAGYGFVQGQHLTPWMCSPVGLLTVSLSEPCAGTHTRSRVVDGLPACLIHPHFQARHAGAVSEHDSYVPCSRRRGHCWFVKNIMDYPRHDPH